MMSTADSVGSVDTNFHDRWWEAHREQFDLIPYLQRLLAEGEPVTLEQVAAASSRPVGDVEALLRQHPRRTGTTRAGSSVWA